MNFTKNAYVAMFVVTSLALVGCGTGEPSEKEMLAAMQESDPGDNSDLKKTNCEKAGEHSYKCGVTTKDGKGMVMNMTFTKVDGKWQIAMN